MVPIIFSWELPFLRYRDMSHIIHDMQSAHIFTPPVYSARLIYRSFPSVVNYCIYLNRNEKYKRFVEFLNHQKICTLIIIFLITDYVGLLIFKISVLSFLHPKWCRLGLSGIINNERQIKMFIYVYYLKN